MSRFTGIFRSQLTAGRSFPQAGELHPTTCVRALQVTSDSQCQAGGSRSGGEAPAAAARFCSDHPGAARPHRPQAASLPRPASPHSGLFPQSRSKKELPATKGRCVSTGPQPARPPGAGLGAGTTHRPGGGPVSRLPGGTALLLCGHPLASGTAAPRPLGHLQPQGTATRPFRGKGVWGH